MRTIWRACGIALLGAFGFGTAYAVAGSATAAIPTTSVTLPTVTLPTVSVPTLPTTTTVTVPTLPTTTSVTVPLPTTTATVTVPPPIPVTTAVAPPTPPPAPSTPRLTLPTPASTSQPAAPSTTAAAPGAVSQTDAFAAAPTRPDGASAAGPSAWSSAAAGRSPAAARVTRFDVSRERFANRGKRRGATVVRFRLSRAARLVLVVRGPGPSCATVARIAFRGHAGANRFRFDGRIDGRPLEPGTYLLTPRLRGSRADLGRAYVTIVPPGAPKVARVLPVCRTTEPARPFLAGVEGAGIPSSPADGGAADADVAATPSDEGVRSAESPPFPALPGPRMFDAPDPLPGIFGLAVLALLVVSLIGIAVEVVRQLRRSPQP